MDQHCLQYLQRLESKDMKSLTIEELKATSLLFQHCANLSQSELLLRVEDMERETKKARLEIQELDTKFRDTAPDEVVKFNVRGQYFSTRRANLIREHPTFFSVMLNGRWNLELDPSDHAIFIDRSPVRFGMVLDYLAGTRIPMEALSQTYKELLLEEAIFYQIPSLVSLLQPLSFNPHTMDVFLSENNTVATRITDVDQKPHRVISSLPLNFATTGNVFSEQRVKINQGLEMAIGLAPFAFVSDPSKSIDNCGWFVDQPDGALYAQTGEDNKAYGRKISPGSIVSVRLHRDGIVSFAVDGEDWGPAFSGVHSGGEYPPLFLAVDMVDKDDSVTILSG